MTNRKLLSAIGGFFDVLGSAVAVSRAVEARRKPAPATCRTLGIDPAHSARSAAVDRSTCSRPEAQLPLKLRPLRSRDSALYSAEGEIGRPPAFANGLRLIACTRPAFVGPCASRAASLACHAKPPCAGKAAASS